MIYNAAIAKKTWKCIDCSGKIKPGERYLYENHIRRKNTRVIKICSNCLNLYIFKYCDVEDQIITIYKFNRKNY